MARQLIDTGVPGDGTTGDTLNEGGQTINQNVNRIWDRLAGPDDELVSTGPFKTTLPTPLVRNTKYEVNTSGGTVNLEIAPATDGLYFTGDVIHLRDSRGNWGSSPVILAVGSDDGDIRGENSVIFNQSYTEIRLTCIDGTANSWIYEVIGLNQESNQLIDINQNITTASPFSQAIYDTDEYHAVKVLITASSNVDSNEKTVSEILITDNATDGFFTEYAVLNTTTNGDPVVTTTFSKVSNNIVMDVALTNDFSSGTLQIIDIQRIEKLN